MVKLSSIPAFAPIRLNEMDRVQLMNRTDTKYWFHASRLHGLLKEIQEYYFILKIDGETALPYSTVYYDTQENKMFSAHHNGKLNRFKIRRRSYVLSDISFLEVKLKNNKGRTIKKRINTKSKAPKFNKEEQEFLNWLIPFSVDDLQETLLNNFKRITLVNKNFKERCTIDFSLRFESNEKQIALENLVIVEIKSDGSPSNSPLALALRDQRIKTSGFSKYCIGRSLTDSSLKRNAFKAKIRSIEKTINTTENLFNSI
ncbi:polyphosphate polymerase domain-containing protein [uncultured Draconibacterium sp.]|uniref:polyphosphate polymerase domain-containing protein n=1 Tax=uncultured Draconibacterium sp. TaxID=1573823 RepID=UPI00321781AE